MMRRRKEAADGKVLVVVPVYGHHEMTHDLVTDLRRESAAAEVVVVDNRGDYPVAGDETVLRPGSNLGWAGGTNHGTLELRRSEHVGFVWLNNDTRLSQGFIGGLVQSWRETGAGLLGPRYDCYWLHQRLRRPVPVDTYRPRRLYVRAPFLDGTCLFVPAATVDAIGLLDAGTFSPVGWGAEIDYGLRARAAGLDVIVTSRSYLHHEKSVTGTTVFDGLEGYAARGYPVLVEGMARKWGDEWRARANIDPATSNTAPANWRERLRGRHSGAAGAAVLP